MKLKIIDSTKTKQEIEDVA